MKLLLLLLFINIARADTNCFDHQLIETLIKKFEDIDLQLDCKKDITIEFNNKRKELKLDDHYSIVTPQKLSVTPRWYLVKSSSIYIRVNTFNSSGKKSEYKSFVKELESFLKNHPKKQLYIDLRGNGGGELQNMQYLLSTVLELEYLDTELFQSYQSNLKKLVSYIKNKKDNFYYPQNMSSLKDIIRKFNLYEINNPEDYSGIKVKRHINLLIDEKCFSACQLFLYEIKLNYPRTKIYADSIFNNELSRYNPVGFHLPQKNMVFIQPLGSFELYRPFEKIRVDYKIDKLEKDIKALLILRDGWLRRTFGATVQWISKLIKR